MRVRCDGTPCAQIVISRSCLRDNVRKIAHFLERALEKGPVFCLITVTRP